MDDNNNPPTDNNPNPSSDTSFRDRIEEFLKLCETLRGEALANGLDKEQFNHLLASILQEEEQEAELKNALHTTRVEEFLQTCQALRTKAKAQGMSRDKLDIELIAALMDNQAQFESMKQQKEEKEKDAKMMQSLIGKLNKPNGQGQGR